MDWVDCCRDVLNVLGMYPGDPGAPGADSAGVVVATGSAVKHLQPGKRSAMTSHLLMQALIPCGSPFTGRIPLGGYSA